MGASRQQDRPPIPTLQRKKFERGALELCTSSEQFLTSTLRSYSAFEALHLATPCDATSVQNVRVGCLIHLAVCLVCFLFFWSMISLPGPLPVYLINFQFPWSTVGPPGLLPVCQVHRQLVCPLDGPQGSVALYAAFRLTHEPRTRKAQAIHSLLTFRSPVFAS